MFQNNFVFENIKITIMTNIRLFLIFIVCNCLFFISAKSQNDTAKFGIKFNGFVNSQIMFDSRQTVGGRETMLVLYPDNIKTDRKGKDINATPSLNQLAMISRLSGKIWGPDALGAKTSALLEGDFSGQTNSDNNGFRLRHAYLKLNWQKSELLIGQYWHPFDVPEMLPGSLSLNTGAPFHAFSRHIQLRYSCNIADFKIIATAASQRDYASDGPLGVKSDYIRNAVVPDMHLQLHYKYRKHLLGAGIDYKILQPRLHTDSNYKSNSKLSSTAIIAFAKLDFKSLDIKFQSSWGENLSEHTMLGGYVEKEIDSISKEIKYANMSALNIWMDISTKAKYWKFAIFAAYTQNLGYSSEIAAKGKFYGRGNNIDYLYRLAPRITYSASQMVFGSEFEYTVAAYGTPDSKGKVKNTNEVSNFRLLFSATYNF